MPKSIASKTYQHAQWDSMFGFDSDSTFGGN